MFQAVNWASCSTTDMFDGEFHSGSNQHDHSNHGHISPSSLVGVSSVVTFGIHDPSKDPNPSTHSAKVRHLQSPNHQHQKELGIVFHRVLMRSENTVEGDIVRCVYIRIRDLELISGDSDLHGLPGNHHDGSNCR